MGDWEADALKICVIGTAASGKTALINRFKTGAFSTELPQRLDEFTMTTKVDGKDYQVTIADTLAGDDRARRLAYMDSNCFLICFAYNSPQSLSQVSTWVKDLTITHQPARPEVPTPYFLVGTCSDADHAVTEAEVKTTKEKHEGKITEIFSVSSKDGTGVQELWTAVSRACVKNHTASGPDAQPASKPPKGSDHPNPTGGAASKTSGGGGRRGCQIL